MGFIKLNSFTWKKSRSIRKRKAIIYIKRKLKENELPSYKELNKEFGIHYFNITTRELYLNCGIKFLNIKHKPSKSLDIIRRELINYVKQEIKNKHYPSRRELERTFHLRLTDLFKRIKDLYKSAGFKYVQKNSQELKKRKALYLTQITISILPKLNLNLIKACETTERGIDIIAKDEQNKLIGIELKAYNKNEMVKRKNIYQLKNFLKTKKLLRIILITTTSKIQNNLKMPKNIEIMFFEDIKRLCDKKYTNKLDFIRDYSIHEETDEHKLKRNLIINYVKNKVKKDGWITHKALCKNLRLDPLTYFKNLSEIYIKANIKIPFNKLRFIRNKNLRGSLKERLYNQTKKYVKKEVLNGHYPSGLDIQKEFSVGHIWRYFKITNVYKDLEIPYRYERVPRTS